MPFILHAPRQIHAEYGQCPQAFTQAIILCEARDVRDYHIQGKDQEIITGGSAFNIKATLFGAWGM